MAAVDHLGGERIALLSASQTPASETPEPVVFITNFFDQLRRLTEAENR